MAKRKKLIVGNWKMNLTVHEASLFVHRLGQKIQRHQDVEIALAPTMLCLQPLSLQIHKYHFKLAAQNLYWRDSGAFTGEVSASQLRGLVDYSLVGHSERRHIFGETIKDTQNKLQAAIRNQICPILCVGETAGERADGETNDVLHDQLIGGLANVTSEEIESIVIAYEPVWAIGTGKNALPNDVLSAVRTIRRQIEHLYGKKAAESVRILYGGSVTTESTADYLKIDGIDGLLVGGASLSEQTFAAIIEKAHRHVTQAGH